jgi:peptidoglycan/LPS O-acetylase OafA/YrhL
LADTGGGGVITHDLTATLPIPSVGSTDLPQSSQPAPPRAASDFNVAAHGLRGLASLMVVGAHILGGTARHVYQANADYVNAVEHPWYLGTFGVELFFIISGFVILPSAIKYAPRAFALRRLLRIYPLFFVLSLLFVALNAFTNAYPKINNVESVVSGLLFINLFTGTEQLTPNAWSLTFEVMFYVLTCGVVHFMFRKPTPILAAAAVAASALFVAAFPIAIYFLAGVAIRIAYRKQMPSIAYARGFELLFFLLAVTFASQGHFEYEWKDFTNPVVIPIFLFTSVYFYLAIAPGSLTSIVMDNRVMAYVGTVSYSLYLVHPYVYYVARRIFVEQGWFTADIVQSIVLFSIVVTSISFAVTHFVHISLERWPYQWFFHQRIYRTKAPRNADAADGAMIEKAA